MIVAKPELLTVWIISFLTATTATSLNNTNVPKETLATVNNTMPEIRGNASYRFRIGRNNTEFSPLNSTHNLKWTMNKVPSNSSVFSGVYIVKPVPVSSGDNSTYNQKRERDLTPENTTNSDQDILSFDDLNYSPRPKVQVLAGQLNVTNCTSKIYDTDVVVKCQNVVVKDVFPYIPDTATTLQVRKCSGQNSFVQPSLDHLTRLKTLTLYECRIRYITSKFLQGLTNLENLSLQSNEIHVLSSLLFKNTPKISYLDLRGNYIRSLYSVSVAVQNLTNLKTLRLDENKILEMIYQRDLERLRNSSIETLTLTDCVLSYVEPEAFDHIPKLKSLMISVNPIERTALHNITKGLTQTDIEQIELRGMTSLFPTDNFITTELEPLVNTKVRFLDLESNFIRILGNYAFPGIKSLKRLNLNKCFLEEIDLGAFENLTNLEELTLAQNRLVTVTFQVPSLTVLDMSSNPGPGIIKTEFLIASEELKSLKNLRIYLLNEVTYPDVIKQNMFSDLYNLEVLQIKHAGVQNISDYAFENLKSLKKLSLSGNVISELTSNSFVGLENLRQLSLSSNSIGYMADTTVFTPLASLEVLDLTGNQLKQLPPDLFTYNTRLELVYLRQNLIREWDYEVFAANGSLRVLLLNNNFIENITPAMLTTFMRLEVLDISENAFACNTCDMNRFQKWIMNPGNTTVNKLTSRPLSYMCTHKNVSIINATIPDELCLPMVDRTALIVLLTIAVILLITTVSSFVLFKLRWYVRYFIFNTRCRVKKYKDVKNERRYEFDAFVSYSSSDLTWVKDELVPNLEGPGCGFRLCLHDRDFMIGSPITENILESIDKSRKTIMVLTEDYVKSNWCMFELHMAQHRLFEETRDALLLIRLKEVPIEKLPKQLKYLMKTRTYVDWISEQKSSVGNRLFWKRLREALIRPEQVHTLNMVI